MPGSPNLNVDHLLSQAWATFKRQPGLCISSWVVFSLLTGSHGGGGGGGGEGGPVDAALVGALLLFALFAGGLTLLLGGPIRGGYDLAMARLQRGDDSVTFTDIFAGFTKFLPLLLTFVIHAGCVLGGLLLCLVPGLIIMIGLWPAYLLVMEDDLEPVEAITTAWKLTQGHKGQLFVLVFASLGLFVIGTLACFVGLLVTGPVVQLAWIGAYDELRKGQAADGFSVTGSGALATEEMPGLGSSESPAP